ncbi:MAG: M14 family zinc carboxypeptidase [Bacteroidia bacterium]
MKTTINLHQLSRAILTLLLLFSAHNLSAQTYHKVKLNGTKIQYENLARAGVNLDEGLWSGNSLLSDFAEAELDQIKKSGIAYEIVISDVSAYYASQNRNDADYLGNFKTSWDRNCRASDPINHTVPTGFSLGSMGGYFTYDEMLDHLDTMAARYPNLVKARAEIDTFRTAEGRPIYWLKISDNPNQKENEPRVLYSALSSGREPITLSSSIFYMYYLLENYGLDDRITYLIDNTELYFVPCMNPDGYVYNQTTNPNGGGLWRKNRRNNGNGSFGVNLDRNFGYEWGPNIIGSSGVGSSPVYRGRSPFSEPETQAIKFLCDSSSFGIVIDQRAYNDNIQYPWGYTFSLNPNSDRFNRMGTEFADEYRRDVVPASAFYLTNGSFADWAYGERRSKPRAMSFVVETGNSFWPLASKIETLCKQNIYLNTVAGLMANDYVKLEDSKDQVLLSGTTGFLRYDLKALGLKSLQYPVEVSITPLSQGLVLSNSSKTYTSLPIDKTTADSIGYTLSSNLPNYSEIQYLLKWSNGEYETIDTVTKVFIRADTVYNDPCETLTNWSSDLWGVVSEDGKSVLHDSPRGPFPGGLTNIITFKPVVDLVTVDHAFLSYRCKWDFDDFDRYFRDDHAVLEVSTDLGTSWETPCTSHGASQGLEMVYKYKQEAWIHEEIDLSQYLGNMVMVRFRLNSDPYVPNGEGFYLDDFSVMTVGGPPTGIEEQDMVFGLTLFPNPANSEIHFMMDQGSLSGPMKVSCFNSLGKIINEKEYALPVSEGSLDISHLPSGLYFLKLQCENGAATTQKFMIKR